MPATPDWVIDEYAKQLKEEERMKKLNSTITVQEMYGLLAISNSFEDFKYFMMAMLEEKQK